MKCLSCVHVLIIGRYKNSTNCYLGSQLRGNLLLVVNQRDFHLTGINTSWGHHEVWIKQLKTRHIWWKLNCMMLLHDQVQSMRATPANYWTHEDERYIWTWNNRWMTNAKIEGQTLKDIFYILGSYIYCVHNYPFYLY